MLCALRVTQTLLHRPSYLAVNTLLSPAERACPLPTQPIPRPPGPLLETRVVAPLQDYLTRELGATKKLTVRLTGWRAT